MHLCYVDESGTSVIPGNTSHFILCGVSIPIWNWRDADNDVTKILTRFGLANAELHTAWLLRNYLEQQNVKDFAKLSHAARRSSVESERKTTLLRLQKTQQIKKYKRTKKDYEHTKAYIHLTRDERRILIAEVADCVGGWDYATIFAECINKIHFDPTRTLMSVDTQAFEQVVSRFEQYLARLPQPDGRINHGLLIHDNNQTVARKHTLMMRNFHEQGTLWTKIQHTIETPLFVDSQLTRMVQIADLCSYALRRFCENGEKNLMKRIFVRADKVNNRAVGVRHFSGLQCPCEICDAHHRGKWVSPAASIVSAAT